jgi:hypothetical protein
VIAFLLIIYTAAVLVLFKVMHLRPRPYLIAGIIVAALPSSCAFQAVNPQSSQTP